MLNIIFIGAPGVGKGTQSALIEKDYSIAHIATGDMLRENIANGTELGKTAKSYMDKGELVPDSLVIDMLTDRIKKDDCKNGFMLDGFPRTMEQAKELSKILDSLNYKINAVIDLYASENIIIERLLNRGRADDNEETIRNRLKVFESQSKPVLEYYNDKVKIIKIESVGTPEEVYARIKKELDTVK
ncbi:adenylate kinase [uncultured Brachyspira sp.]|uniref:adenylate kinase n=1 Tax=uncultured Brachyspira sp. TaxID=221953 RepID=UPI00262E1268|nr:adenylate kinase [uncultured Brachyspira sp.]